MPVGPDRWELETHRWRQLRRAIVASARGLCGLCGHGPGADTVDHAIPPSRGGARFDPANLIAAHGKHPCPTCGRKCNSEKGSMTITEWRVFLATGKRPSRRAPTPSRDW